MGFRSLGLWVLRCGVLGFRVRVLGGPNGTSDMPMPKFRHPIKESDGPVIAWQGGRPFLAQSTLQCFLEPSWFSAAKGCLGTDPPGPATRLWWEVSPQFVG